MTDGIGGHPIKAVTFDLDDTLWDCDEVLNHANQKFFEHLHEHYPKIPESFSRDTFRELITAYVKEGGPDSHDFGALRKRAIWHAAETVGYDPERVVETAYEVFAQSRQEVRLFDSVLPLLTALKESGLTVGAITNGTANALEMKYLNDFMDFALRPSDAGVAKPHINIFESARALARCQPHEILHVGDSYPCDVLGAKEAGFKTVWINNPDLAPSPWRDCPHPDPHHADHVIEHIDHFHTILHHFELPNQPQ